MYIYISFHFYYYLMLNSWFRQISDLFDLVFNVINILDVYD